jgi:hypothetical protein
VVGRQLRRLMQRLPLVPAPKRLRHSSGGGHVGRTARNARQFLSSPTDESLLLQIGGHADRRGGPVGADRSRRPRHARVSETMDTYIWPAAASTLVGPQGDRVLRPVRAILRGGASRSTRRPGPGVPCHGRHPVHRRPESAAGCGVQPHRGSGSRRPLCYATSGWTTPPTSASTRPTQAATSTPRGAGIR